jgi:hypothetical protein
LIDDAKILGLTFLTEAQISNIHNVIGQKMDNGILVFIVSIAMMLIWLFEF